MLDLHVTDDHMDAGFWRGIKLRFVRCSKLVLYKKNL